MKDKKLLFSLAVLAVSAAAFININSLSDVDNYYVKEFTTSDGKIFHARTIDYNMDEKLLQMAIDDFCEEYDRGIFRDKE